MTMKCLLWQIDFQPSVFSQVLPKVQPSVPMPDPSLNYSPQALQSVALTSSLVAVIPGFITNHSTLRSLKAPFVHSRSAQLGRAQLGSSSVPLPCSHDCRHLEASLGQEILQGLTHVFTASGEMAETAGD